MKKFISFIFTFITVLMLTSCASQRLKPLPSYPMNETWPRSINTNPNCWISHADQWFFTGEPEPLNQYAISKPMSSSMSDMWVRVPDFTRIRIDGDFQVQLTGQQLHNSVEILGPNHLVRLVAVDTSHNTLYLHQVEDCKHSLHPVIVRIGVNTLNKLVENGNGTFLGRGILSDNLVVYASGNSRVILQGKINVTKVVSHDNGNITIIGVHSRHTNLYTAGNGTINLNGCVGINYVYNDNGNIHIIGAYTNNLCVFAKGCSTTKIVGNSTLKKLTAVENSKVYLYWVNGNSAFINVNNNACVGLAGFIANFNLFMNGSAQFVGKYLETGNAYVTTRGSAHANVSTDAKLFANAFDNSSVYFYGSPSIMSRFLSGNATVIPVTTDDIAHPPVRHDQPYAWDAQQK